MDACFKPRKLASKAVLLFKVIATLHCNSLFFTVAGITSFWEKVEVVILLDNFFYEMLKISRSIGNEFMLRYLYPSLPLIRSHHL